MTTETSKGSTGRKEENEDNSGFPELSRRKMVASLVSLGSLSSFSHRVAAESTDNSWSVERITYGFLPSLIFSKRGIPHISYYDGDNLGYAKKKSGEWSANPIIGHSSDPDNRRDGQYNSIALDRNQTPHITYHQLLSTKEGLSSELHYVYHDGTDWQHEPVDSVGRAPYNSIAINPLTNNPNVAYDDGSLLKLAKNSGGAWDIQEVDSAGSAPSLSFDVKGNPHVAYHDTIDETLNYAYRDGEEWVIRTVGPSAGIGSEGYGISLELTSTNYARIAFIGPADDLRYAQWNGDSWQTETVDDSIDVESASLALNSKGDPHIGYGSAAQYPDYGNVNYAVNENDTWTLERLSSETGNNGLSLALGRTNRPAIVYEGTENNGDLNYATKD